MDIRTSAKARASPLPSFSDVQEKHHLTTKPSRFFTTFYLPLPGRRRLVVPLPIPPSLWIRISTRLGRRNTSFLVWAILAASLWVAFALSKAVISQVHPRWARPVLGDPPTLVFGREDLRKIWEWEISSGHYPSTRPSESLVSLLSDRPLTVHVHGAVPAEIRMAVKPQNPGIPPPEHQRSFSNGAHRAPSTIGVGSRRAYIDIQAEPPNTAYPPRPPPGTVADLDVIMDNCDFDDHKVGTILALGTSR